MIEANKLINELSNKNLGYMQIELIKANDYKNMDELEKCDKLIENVVLEHPNDYTILLNNRKVCYFEKRIYLFNSFCYIIW